MCEGIAMTYKDTIDNNIDSGESFKSAAGYTTLAAAQIID